MEDSALMARQETETSGLSRDAVIQAALDLLDSVGAGGLSMRAVADRLGVKAASLYWHLRDKEQLLESVAEAVLDRVEVAGTRASRFVAVAPLVITGPMADSEGGPREGLT